MKIQRQSCKKPLVWKRYIDDVLSLCNTSKGEKEQFLEKVNTYHPTIKFMAEISETEITFLDTKMYKHDRFQKESILYVNALQNNLRRPFNARISTRVIHQASRKALRLHRKTPRKQYLRKNSRLNDRGYPASVIKRQSQK